MHKKWNLRNFEYLILFLAGLAFMVQFGFRWFGIKEAMKIAVTANIGFLFILATYYMAAITFSIYSIVTILLMLGLSAMVFALFPHFDGEPFFYAGQAGKFLFAFLLFFTLRVNQKKLGLDGLFIASTSLLLMMEVVFPFIESELLVLIQNNLPYLFLGSGITIRAREEINEVLLLPERKNLNILIAMAALPASELIVQTLQ